MVDSSLRNIIELLLDNGADPEIRNRDGKFPCEVCKDEKLGAAIQTLIAQHISMKAILREADARGVAEQDGFEGEY